MSSIDGFPIDVVKQFTPKLSSKTTDHPIEKGADLTDHIQAQPFEFTLECIISANPIGAIANDPTRINTDPAKDGYAKLVSVHEARKPVTVITPRGTYTMMVMTELTAPVDAASGNSLLFTVTFKHITIVENKRTTIRMAVPNGPAKKKLGDRQAELGDSAVAIDYVIRVATSVQTRAHYTKLYGKPVSCVDATEVNWDHFVVDPKKQKPDGCMDNVGHYHAIQSSSLVRSNDGVQGQDHTTAHYNAATGHWEYPDGSKANESSPGIASWSTITDQD